MTLRGIFSYQNLDSTEDLNSLNARIIDRGIFENGLLIPSATSLEISISPFRAVGYDGMVVISDATETVSVTDDATSYLICYAKWLNNTTPYIEIKTISEAEWSLSSNKNYFITFAKLTVPSGATYIDNSYIDYTDADYAEKAGKSNWRPRVSDYSLLPTIGNREGDVRVAGNRAYIWDSTTSTWLSLITGENANLILGNWEKRTISLTAGDYLECIAFGNDVIVIGTRRPSNYSPFYISNDKGVTWDRITPGIATTKWIDVIFTEITGTGLFVAASSSQIYTSPDGEVWTLNTAVPSASTDHIYQLHVTSTAVIAVGYDNSGAHDAGFIYYTEDLVTWYDYTIDHGGSSSEYRIRDISYDGIVWTVVGDYNTGGWIGTNPDITDNTNWTFRQYTAYDALSITNGNGRFIVGAGISIYEATDITSWNQYIEAPSGYTIKKVLYIPQYIKFLFFAYKSASGASYKISINGVNWEDFIGAINTTDEIMDVATDDRNTVMIICQDGEIFFSLRI